MPPAYEMTDVSRAVTRPLDRPYVHASAHPELEHCLQCKWQVFWSVHDSKTSRSRGRMHWRTILVLGKEQVYPVGVTPEPSPPRDNDLDHDPGFFPRIHTRCPAP